MSLVKSPKVIKFFKENDVYCKTDCICFTQVGIKRCRLNCTNTSRQKINYDRQV